LSDVFQSLIIQENTKAYLVTKNEILPYHPIHLSPDELIYVNFK